MQDDQERAEFEAAYEAWRVSTWHPLSSDIARGRKECPEHWNTSDKNVAWRWWQAARFLPPTPPAEPTRSQAVAEELGYERGLHAGSNPIRTGGTS